jgi:hypothetical protein
MKLAGFKTLITSGLVSIAGTIAAVPEQLQQLGIDWKSILPQAIPIQRVGLLVLGLGLVFGLLRLVTRTPPFQNYPIAPPPPPQDLMQYAPTGSGPNPLPPNPNI